MLQHEDMFLDGVTHSPTPDQLAKMALTPKAPPSWIKNVPLATNKYFDFLNEDSINHSLMMSACWLYGQANYPPLMHILGCFMDVGTEKKISCLAPS